MHGLSLVPSTHNAETDVHVALLHESRNDRVEGPFVSCEGVGQARFESKSCTAVLKRETETRRDKARAVTGVVALDQGYDIAIFIDG